MKKKRFLVTGGTGFIGSNICKYLVKQNYPVKIYDNNSRGEIKKIANIKNKVKFIKGDIRDKKLLSKSLRKTDAVIHLAYVNGTKYFYSNPVKVLEIAVKGIINVIDGCIKNKIKELYLASSSEVYQTPQIVPTDESIGLSIPDPLNPRYSYGGGKLISELMLINYAPRHFDKSIIIRPHNVYGPDMGWEHVIPQFALRMRGLLKKESGSLPFPIQGSGQESRSFVFIDDFIDGMLLAMEKGTQQDIYHVGTSDEITIQYLAERIGNYYSRQVTIIPGELSKGGTSRRCPSINKLKNIGFHPKTKLDDGLATTVEWYDANAHLRPVKND